MQNQLIKNKKMVEMATSLVEATRVKRSHFRENYNSGIMVHAISKVFVVSTRQKATQTQLHWIKNSTGVITIIAITKRKAKPDDVVHTVK